VAFVSPVTTQVVVLASLLHVLGVSTPSSAVTEYPVIAEPLSAGALHDTDKVALPGTTETEVVGKRGRRQGGEARR
jgi:hypothetical protein